MCSTEYQTAYQDYYQFFLLIIRHTVIMNLVELFELFWVELLIENILDQMKLYSICKGKDDLCLWLVKPSFALLKY